VKLNSLQAICAAYGDPDEVSSADEFKGPTDEAELGHDEERKEERKKNQTQATMHVDLTSDDKVAQQPAQCDGPSRPATMMDELRAESALKPGANLEPAQASPR